ncbi:hypothetical protein PsorP6_002350 [Peronosclerospora sorghi]|uniref:Uncharacterized protein n=1 Tax=Peronosclerospora sorghi TaxID=230839 RepID=A0ACC0WX47_9STRA|nr:hypothetical protein PsorP6_002350 [Peronosclerospora sorghi]
MFGTGLKVAVLAALVACYVHPQILLRPFLGEGMDGADIDASQRGVRGLLILLSYGMATARPSWFRVLVAVAMLQLILWLLKLADNSLLGLKVEDEAKFLFGCSAMCFGAVLSIVLFGDKSDARARFRNRLLTFYMKHNPEKLHQVDELVNKYELNEELLFQRLHRKYNAFAGGVESHSVIKNIDENEFLYEEDEEGRIESDEEYKTTVDEKDHVEKYSQQSLNNSGKEQAVGKRISDIAVFKTRQSQLDDYDDIDGTPPVSPRSAKNLVHKNRLSSTLIRDAIAQARQAQQERIERRIASIASKRGHGYAGH